jgi:O-acetyl-ADP-ribose deacetylase (regulator of RNase III)
MIREVSGDILLTKAAALAHGVAPNDAFATGLAHSLREQWPAMYKDFRHYCQTQHPVAGGAWIWSGVGGKRIINLLTQEAAYDHGAKAGRATTANVNHALRELRKIIEHEKLTSVALPKLATGVGGLKWEEVLPLIQHHLGDVGIPIIVYSTYHPGLAAEEKL